MVGHVQSGTEGYVGKSAYWQGSEKGSRKAKPPKQLPRKAAIEA